MDDNNIQALDFENFDEWKEFRKSLYPENKEGKRRLVKIPVNKITPSYVKKIIERRYPFDTIFEIQNLCYINSNNLNLNDYSIFTTYDLDNVIECVKMLNDNNYNNIVQIDGMSIKKVIKANLKLQCWADEINYAKFEGRALSPLEKYLYAYKMVTQYTYYKEETNPCLSRVSTHILNDNGKNIVCLGYSNLLVELCKKIGIPCATQYLKNKEPNKSSHANSMVYIKDEKYHINGAYLADPCFDSASPTQRSKHVYSMLKLDDADKVYREINFDLVNLEETFGVLTYLPNKILYRETCLPEYERENVEDMILRKEDFGMLTCNTFNKEDLVLANMVVNHVIYPNLSNEQLCNFSIEEFVENDGKVPY